MEQHRPPMDSVIDLTIPLVGPVIDLTTNDDDDDDRGTVDMDTTMHSLYDLCRQLTKYNFPMDSLTFVKINHIIVSSTNQATTDPVHYRSWIDHVKTSPVHTSIVHGSGGIIEVIDHSKESLRNRWYIHMTEPLTMPTWLFYVQQIQMYFIYGTDVEIAYRFIYFMPITTNNEEYNAKITKTDEILFKNIGEPMKKQKKKKDLVKYMTESNFNEWIQERSNDVDVLRRMVAAKMWKIDVVVVPKHRID